MIGNNWLWFEEAFENELGRNIKIAIKDLLTIRESVYQRIEVYDTVSFGKMLVLDGVIMLTQYDNAAYHEMIVHVPMNSHPHPQQVLIVGGGDGGTLTEVLKHPTVEKVVLCEIDEEVIKVAKQYFSEFAPAFDDTRLQLVIEDAAKYVTQKRDVFDVICVDSSDPIGPAEVLFKKQFYQDMHQALTSNGIAVTQSESMYYNADLIEDLYRQNTQVFAYANYYYTLVPTYPSGTIGFSFCSKNFTPFDHLQESRIKQLPNLKYYSADIHRAAFALPAFLKSRLKG